VLDARPIWTATHEELHDLVDALTAGINANFAVLHTPGADPDEVEDARVERPLLQRVKDTVWDQHIDLHGGAFAEPTWRCWRCEGQPVYEFPHTHQLHEYRPCRDCGQPMPQYGEAWKKKRGRHR